MDNNAVALSAIALAGTITTGFFRLVSKQIKAHEKIALGLAQLAKATKDGNREAKERNGHLADLVIQQAEMSRQQMDKPVNIQTVETQVVKEQK